MHTLTITRPDDFHLHLRDGPEMASVVAASARCFARAIIMPNLRPPVVNAREALAYRERILKALDGQYAFEPLMTLYLTEATTPEEVREAATTGHVHAVKLYPAGATTHSDQGVKRIENTYPVLEAMAEAGLPLLVHGEVTDTDVDPFDREAVFIDRVLAPLVARFPGLKVVLEHVTTAEAVAFVREAPARVAATITAHHLIYSRADMFREGLRPHLYCLPLLKREHHRRALVEAATGGDGRFFLGTDSAPHGRTAKEAASCCAGIYSAPAALELYAAVFEEAGALDRLNDFAAVNGARFYGLPPNAGTVTLERTEWRIPDSLPFGAGEVVPLGAGEPCRWKLCT